MGLSKRMKTRDMTRQTAEKNIKKALQLIKDIDKSTSIPSDFAETFALHDTLEKRFDKTKPSDEAIFNILIVSATRRSSILSETAYGVVSLA